MNPGRPRLLLVEFLRLDEAVHRNEKSMLFPFLLGMGRARCEVARWVLLGASIDCALDARQGRSLRPSLPSQDWDALFRVVEEVQPTHVLTSERLPDDVADRIRASSSLERLSLAPVASELGADAAGGGGVTTAVANPDSPRHLGRTGWFLEWLGEGLPANPGFLVDSVEPDYAATSLNVAAERAESPVTVLGGVQCSNRRPLRANPFFEGVPLGVESASGCSFCGNKETAWNDPAADSLALAVRQLRAIARTAGPAGRYRGFADVYDVELLHRFDELVERILALDLPPSTLLFSPRIDDLLGARPRFERALPGLAAAGHRVKVMSMGVENFSEHENGRFNKGIRLAQVDALLAMVARWDAEFPGVVEVFKGRTGEGAEIGFILFTPWTTLDDLRLNLRLGRERGFPEHGYWLFSTVQLRPEAAISALARRDGLVVDRFDERGLLYGAGVTGAEPSRLAPWRFRDPLVARVFHVLVRIAAADREGPGCRFFGGDEDFAAYGRAWEAVGRPSPFAVATAMLDVLGRAEIPATPFALLAAALETARRPPSAPGTDAPGLAELPAVREVLSRALPDVRIARAWRENRADTDDSIGLSIVLATRTLTLFVAHARPGIPRFAEGRRFVVAYDSRSAPANADEERLILRILAACERRLGGGPASRRERADRTGDSPDALAADGPDGPVGARERDTE